MSFWSQPLEQYFPMEVPPGSHSTLTRWRRMAQQWCSTGVDRRSAAFQPWYWNGTEQRFHMGPGAVWVNGFYAANSQEVDIATPGNNGIIVARYQPELQEVRLVFRPGVGIGGEVKDPEGWYEAPLIFLRDDAYTQDLRRLVPLPWAPPPVTEMPAWVPRGLIGTSVGPAAATGPGHVSAHAAAPFSWPRFVVGRSYRVRASWWFTTTTTGGGQGGQVRFYCRDDTHGEHGQVIMYQGAGQLGEGTFGNLALVVRNAGPGFLVVVAAEPWAGLTPNFLWAANCVRIEVEDATQ